MKVIKFGGSSLADDIQFRKVGDIVISDPERRVVVVSAPGKGVNEVRIAYVLKCEDLVRAIELLAEGIVRYQKEVMKIAPPAVDAKAK